VAEREALAAVIPTTPDYMARIASDHLRGLQASLRALDQGYGGGSWEGTPVGNAATAWSQAYKEWHRCMVRAEHANWREAFGWRREAAKWAKVEIPRKERFDALAAPERARLNAEIPEAKKHLVDVEGRSEASRHFRDQHPEALRRLERLDNQIATSAYELDVERQGLDGVAPEPPQLHAQRWGMDRRFEREAPGLELDRGMELGL
jgi:hypothetical protein